MTQSSEADETFTIDVSDFDLDDLVVSTDNTITISDSVYSITTNSADWISNSGTITLDSNVYTGATDVNIDWIYNNMNIDPDKVERMCKEYPALEKVWRNFKSVYDMVKQDYEGKKEAGEIQDDDIPF